MRLSTWTACLAAGLLSLTACGDGEETREFTDVRTRSQPRHQVPPNLTPEQRLGLVPRSNKRRTPITWRTPPGWEEYEAGSQMRAASWRVKGAPRTDCSLTLLPAQGGVASNVNRWRGEMGLTPSSEPDVAALPKRQLLGMQGTYVDLQGAFSGGRSSGGPIPVARMLGVILEGPKASVFVKFVGPAEVVGNNQAAFQALLDSMVFDPTGAASGGAQSGAPVGKLQWTTPDKWKAQAARAMREATFVPEDMPTGWCYIGLIGGGIEPNLNRWRGEMGQTPLSAAEIEGLTKISFADSEGVFLEVNGEFRGTGGPPLAGATLYGFIAPRGPRMFVFVKMVGPSAEMPAQKDRFLALCRSFR